MNCPRCKATIPPDQHHVDDVTSDVDPAGVVIACTQVQSLYCTHCECAYECVWDFLHRCWQRPAAYKNARDLNRILSKLPCGVGLRPEGESRSRITRIPVEAA